MNGRRAKQRRRAGALAHTKPVTPEQAMQAWDGRAAENMGTIVGWCASEADLTDAREALHDALIKLMGDQRTGSVFWVWREGQHAHELLNQVAVDERSQEILDHYRRVRAHLREYGGFVVIAMAPGNPKAAAS